MKDRDWKDFAEIVGIGAIVASLVFVGLQMRQSHEIALVTLYQMRSDAARELRVVGVENDIIVRAYERMETNDGLGFSDIYAIESYNDLMFNHFENSHFLYQRGFLPDEHWRSDLISFTEFLGEPAAREQWESIKHRFRQSYVDAIDEALGRGN